MSRKKKAEHPDVALAGDLRDYLAKLNLPRVNQSKERVYILYGSGTGEEYTAIYSSREGKRFLEFHLENPMDNVFKALEDTLMKIEAVDKRTANEKYMKIFGTLKLKRSHVPYKEKAGIKEVDSVAAVIRIKKIPVGQRGHLSGDFSGITFKYVIQPFISTVEKYRKQT